MPLGANWATRRAFWADRPVHEEALRKNLLSLETTKTRQGKHDLSFDLSEPERYRHDVPTADVHVLDAGHLRLTPKQRRLWD